MSLEEDLFSDLFEVAAPATKEFDSPISLPVTSEILTEPKSPETNKIKIIFLLPIFKQRARNDWSCEYIIVSSTNPYGCNDLVFDETPAAEVFPILKYSNQLFDVGYVTDNTGIACVELSARIRFLSEGTDRTLVYIGRTSDAPVSLSILTGLKAVSIQQGSRIKFKPISLDPKDTKWNSTMQLLYEKCVEIHSVFIQKK